MKYERISIRYAKALYSLADEMKLTKEVYNDMVLVGQVCDVKEFAKLISSPIIKPAKKNVIINALFKDKINELSLRYLLIIIRKQREALIQNIANQYINIFRIENNIKLTKFISATSINEDLINNVKNTIENTLNSKIELITSVDPKLIGGFVVTVDGKRYDASVKNKLDRLSKEFEKNIYEKGF